VVRGNKKKIARNSNLKIIRMHRRLPAGGDAEKRRGPQGADNVVQSEDRCVE